MFGDDQGQQQQNSDYNSIFNPAPANDGGSSAPAPAPGSPIGPITEDQPPVSAPVAPVQDLSTPEITAQASAPSDVPADDLLNIKQDALQELSPLVGHLEQSAEEKFRTTMMMIQASDDHSLIKTAYEAAKQITDEKARAQALLDVVNEINYFTQQHPQ